MFVYSGVGQSQEHAAQSGVPVEFGMEISDAEGS